MHEKISTRTGFGEGLLTLAAERPDVIVTSADTYRSFALGEFVSRYPERYFEFGIAEQNMVTASGAMAAEGYQVFSVGYSPFLSMRAAEQIRTFVAYPELDVKIVAGLSGLSGDTDGVTHQGTEDLSIVRAIPNLTVLCPADAVAAKAMAKMAVERKGPVYLRLGRGATPVIYGTGQTFTFGRAVKKVEGGSRVVLISCGPCVAEAEKAAQELLAQGIGTTVLDMHTIKPMDARTVCETCQDAEVVVTVEDGSVFGGLGGGVAEILMEAHIMPKHFRRLGLTGFGTAGSLDALLAFFGLDATGIYKTVLGIL